MRFLIFFLLLAGMAPLQLQGQVTNTTQALSDVNQDPTRRVRSDLQNTLTASAADPLQNAAGMIDTTQITAAIDSVALLAAQAKEDSVALATMDSLTLRYLEERNLPYRMASRVPAIDSLLQVVADEDGLFYQLDSTELCILDKMGKPVIDSLLSFTPSTLSKMHLMESLQLPVKDTIRIPLRDSTEQLMRDSLGFFYHIDSVGLIQLDTLGRFMIDSLATFTEREMKYFARVYKKEQKAIADSIRHSTFQMIDTYVLADSLRFQKVLAWTNEPYFNNITRKDVDTSLNSNFHDYNYLNQDVGATYLGTSGSPLLTDNYFKRKTNDRFHFWDVGLSEAYDRTNLPNYNTKTPFTLMSYAGTLFSNKDIEESNVIFMHTQNLSPSTNFQFYYKRRGANGLLENEANDMRTIALTANHLGKRYILHAGVIRNSLKRDENGGAQDDFYIKDTTIEARAVPINLSSASSRMISNQIYINHSLAVPIRLFKKDTLKAGEGTTMLIGHSGQLNQMVRTYNDAISLSDRVGRSFYHDQFYMDPTATADSARTMVFDNRFYLRLQPWSQTAIVSKLEGGAGYEILNNYCFRPEYYTIGNKNAVYHNLYAYAGASGQLSKYFFWNALGRMDIAGYYAGDMFLDAQARFSLYPNPSGIHLTGRFFFKNSTPEWYLQNYYSNHYVWNNEFSKISDTRIEATLSIPHWNLEASFSYGLLNNGTYYDTLGVVRQANEAVSIMTAGLTKNFKVWYLHFDNRVLFQMTSNKELFPLPKISANLRYYLEVPLVKNVLTAQLGAEATFHTAYYVQAYNPALGVFQLQNKQEYGNTPYIDAFINMKWKRATIFVKYVNAAQGWPNGDYFSAPHYIRPQRVIKLGMTWPFYLIPSKNSGDSHDSGSSGNNSPINSRQGSSSSSSGNGRAF